MRFRSALAAGLTLAMLLTAVPTALASTDGADQNLALHKRYTMTHLGNDDTNNAYHNWYPDKGQLTDGQVGSTAWSVKGPWAGWIRNDRHDLVIDLGAEQTIHKLNAVFLQDKSAGIRFPQKVSYFVSDNQVAWAKVGDVDTQIGLDEPGGKIQHYTLDGLNLTGRYVRVQFYTDVWVFVGEVEAWGQPGKLEGAVKPAPTAPEVQPPGGYPLAGSKAAGGKKAQNLMYTGYYYGHATLGKWTPSELLPYVAYLDANHQPTDMMFDSFLILPLGSPAPSGQTYIGGKTTKADWLYQADLSVRPDINAGALDKAVGEAKAALNQPDYKVKVTFAIPLPGVNSNWGDGLDFNPANVGQEQALANRVAAVKWYIDYVRDRWDSMGYEHIDLTGFYWYAESIRYDLSPLDEELVKQVADYVHGFGGTFDWIPFHQSEGFRRWQDLGFDTALMQPNLFFGGSGNRMEENAKLARRYGLGVEIEMDYSVLTPGTAGQGARNKYYAYLDGAYDYHYQNSFMAWYGAYNILWSAERATAPEVRAVYDDTYKFIKGTYAPTYRPGAGDTGSTVLDPTGHMHGLPDKDPAPQN